MHSNHRSNRVPGESLVPKDPTFPPNRIFPHLTLSPAGTSLSLNHWLRNLPHAIVHGAEFLQFTFPYSFPDIIPYLEESPGPWLYPVIEYFFRTFSPSFTRNHTVFRPRTTRRPCDPSPFSQTHSKIHLGITFHLPHQPSPSFRFHHTPTHARRSPTTSVINTK